MTIDGDCYWQSEAEDASMQDEHEFVWRAMLDTIDVDLTGRRILDAGCNRGGFLRLLCAEASIADGSGYDPAAGAIADARRLGRELPLRFEVADTVPAGWGDFDVAFSHEVLYLIGDLGAHATAMLRRAHAPVRDYYAVIGVHVPLRAPALSARQRSPGRPSERLQPPRLLSGPRSRLASTHQAFEWPAGFES